MNQDLKQKVKPFALVLAYTLVFGVIVYGMAWLVYAPAPSQENPYNFLGGGNTSKIKLGTTSTTSTTVRPQDYSCPQCPDLVECSPLVASTCPTLPALPVVTTTLYSTYISELEVSSGGINYYSIRPTKIDFKWQKCNPFEYVDVPYDMIIYMTNQTYNKTWINGTTEVVNRSSEIETKRIKGGCIVVPTACCRCQDGGKVDAINAKVYRRYYSEVLKNCSGLPVVCPMIMTSSKGCQPAVGCIDGRCRMRN